MPYRDVRWSNDSTTWGWIAGLVCGIGLCCFFAYADVVKGALCGFVGILGILFPLLLLLIREVVFPYESEFVVDDVEIRWGRTSQPTRQSRIALNTIKTIILDDESTQIFADTGSLFYQVVGGTVLLYHSHNEPFLRYLAQHHPEIPIRNRDGTPHLVDTAP